MCGSDRFGRDHRAEKVRLVSRVVAGDGVVIPSRSIVRFAVDTGMPGMALVPWNVAAVIDFVTGQNPPKLVQETASIATYRRRFGAHKHGVFSRTAGPQRFRNLFKHDPSVASFDRLVDHKLKVLPAPGMAGSLPQQRPSRKGSRNEHTWHGKDARGSNGAMAVKCG